MTNSFWLGEVKWFNPQRRFGFLVMANGDEIFFHYNDGRFPDVDEKGSSYGKPTVLGPDGKSYHVPDPKPGARILFELAKGSEGRSKASPWCYEHMLVDAYLDYEHDQEPCSICSHPMVEHAGWSGCMVSGCHCGDEEWERSLDEEEPQEVWYTEAPCGHRGYE